MKIELITRDEYIRRTKYWFYITSFYCPVCSRTTTYRERFLESERPRPKDWADRNEDIETYDYCNVL